MPLLSFGCQHRFPGGFEIDLRFEVSHRFTALFGPSGSGKTSVLLMIAGLLPPQAGRIELADRVLLDSASGVCLAPERRRVGMVFQDLLLFPHLSVEDNLRYGQRHRRPNNRRLCFSFVGPALPAEANAERLTAGKAGPTAEFSRVVEVLELGNLLRRFPQNLSGGERQRVALGRALLSGPELLLMDEPLASLDARLVARVLAYLERVVAEWDIPTLFVTHGQAEVRRAADWVVVIDNGRLVGSGTPDEALGQPAPLGWGNAAGPVNLLRLEKVEVCDQQAMARVGGQVLILPPLEAGAAMPSFVQFSPTNVVLSRRDVTGLSVRNHLHGHVRQVLSVHQAVFVAVDVGQILWAEVTPQAARELDLQPGSEVTCLLKVHCLKAVG